jgi:hypothetical protein
MSIRLASAFATAAFLFSSFAHAETPLNQGFSGAIRGCEEWILNPKSWANGPAPFIAAVGLGNTMGPVDSVSEVSLPPPSMRVANHYWRINSTLGAGFVLVVSDRLPMCHITGGGDTDLEPVVEGVLNGTAFASRWEKIGEALRGEMKSTTFRSREDPRLTLLVSRADAVGQRLNHVQVIATATYAMGK